VARPQPQPFQVFRVGGSVRDELLGRANADRDFVVVGATPEMMVASGFTPVGRDFPVFLHPETHEEYALARTERKHGQGYHGFEFFASPEVTLEEDLRRRDLTINAMARRPDGTLVDPFGGERDLNERVLRHVSASFVEDPLRVLRVARFASRLGFDVAPETRKLMRTIVESGELATLAPERVWQEISRGLMEAQPSRMFQVLRECGALVLLLPEFDALFGVRLPARQHPERDAGEHLLLVADRAADRALGLAARYAALAQNVGADVAPALETRTAVTRAEAMSVRLKVPAECRDAARLAARWHRALDRLPSLTSAKVLALLQGTDALRRPERLLTLLDAAVANVCADPVAAKAWPPARLLVAALERVKAVDAGAIARVATGTRAGRGADNVIAKALREARLRALREWKREEAAARPRRKRR
jgi:tRNA nucleotidyltransferase (CCA-adding enzyme)